MFDPYLARWTLTPDGAEILTPAGRLLPVRRGPTPLMLKLAADPEERRGAAVLDWWRGEGAARVVAWDGEALLMERATGTRSLAQMARGGQDDEACRILCATAARLHVPRPHPPRDVAPMDQWFAPLGPFAAARGGLLARCAAAAAVLLAAPREVTMLHGDLHHDNVLDFGPRGWLAIDPKALRGERGYDFATLFTNPDQADPDRPVATDPVRFRRRLEVVCAAAGLERERLLLWILAFTGLSACWFAQDGAEDGAGARIDLAVAAMAAAVLDG